MDIFFENPNDKPVPPEEMVIRSLTAQPYEDGRRIKVDFEITPFLERPNLEIDIHNQDGKLAATLSVVEAIENKMTFTMHLREAQPTGEYTLSMVLFYTDLSPMDEEESTIKDILIENKRVLDSQQTKFNI